MYAVQSGSEERETGQSTYQEDGMIKVIPLNVH